MSARFDPGRHAAGNGLDDGSAPDTWEDIPDRLRSEVVQYPYVALLTAAGVGCLLARGLPIRVLPRLVDIGLRLATAAALPVLMRSMRTSSTER